MDGSWAAAVLVLFAILAACVLSRFADRDASWLSFLTAVLGVTIAFSIVAVVPYDVWQALAFQEEHEDQPTHSLLRSSWVAIYWSTAVLTYLFVPVLMEYEASGDFSIGARIRTSLRRNAVFYVAYGLIVGLLLLLLILRGEVHGSLQSWSIAASNAWGLLVLTVLMGFGLVAVPRHFWHLANPSAQLRDLYISAVAKDEIRLSRLFELQDAVASARAELSAHDLVDREDLHGLSCSQQTAQLAFATLCHTVERCEELHGQLTNRGVDFVCSPGSPSNVSLKAAASREDASLTASPSCHPGRPMSLSSRLDSDGSSRGSSRGGGQSPLHPPPSMQQLAQLHRSLKVAALEARRASCCLDSHIQRCILFEDLDREHFKAAADLLGAPRGVSSRGCFPRARAGANQFWRWLLLLWLRHLRVRVLNGLGHACCLLSTAIVLGQLTMFLDRWNLSMLSLMFRRNLGPWLTQVLCVIPLSYMTYSAYFSIFRLKISGWYGLYGNHNTDIGSLLWCASILARLAAPLCYHFLLLIRVQGTSFQAFMGQMNVVPALGESFNQVFPCLVALLCSCNIFNVYGRIMQCLTLGVIDFELGAGADGEDPLADGKQLVERERRRLAEDFSMEMHEDRRSPLVFVTTPLAVPAG